MGSKRRLALAVAGAVVTAEVAVWLLRPDPGIEPASVSEAAYFTAGQLERARDFATGQRLLGLGGAAAGGGLLALLVLRPPRGAFARAERLARGRPLLSGALVGAGLSVAVGVAGLPFAAAAHERAVDVGLATQEWSGWAWDRARSAAIGAVITAGAAALFLAMMRRFGRPWWLPGAGTVVGLTVVFVWLGPVLLDPVFNRYEALPAGQTRDDVMAVARRAGVDVGDVLVVDASRRTTGANAYVTGLGRTKRVVLYDTLLERFTPEQTRIVVAHELAHVEARDVQRGILWVALVAPPAMYLVMLLTERWSRRSGAAPGTAAVLPALGLALALVAFGATTISSQLSRRVEARADVRSLELTGEPRQFIEMQRRLALANRADPDPPAPVRWLLRSHPSTVERIGAGVAFERRSGAPADPAGRR